MDVRTGNAGGTLRTGLEKARILLWAVFCQERPGSCRTTSFFGFRKALGGMEGVGSYRTAECQNSDSFLPSSGARPAGS